MARSAARTARGGEGAHAAQRRTGAAAEAASDVELVFNNAGVALASGLADSTGRDQARREMEVNYFGPLQLLQRLAPSLARIGGVS